MSDDEDADPAISLGDPAPVDGAPLARITARIHWPIQKSEIDRFHGDAVIRTPDGPQELSSVLERLEETYFSRRQEFESHVRAVIGTGPVPIADADSAAE